MAELDIPLPPTKVSATAKRMPTTKDPAAISTVRSTMSDIFGQMV
jgi:hypothetical protein